MLQDPKMVFEVFPDPLGGSEDRRATTQDSRHKTQTVDRKLGPQKYQLLPPPTKIEQFVFCS